MSLLTRLRRVRIAVRLANMIGLIMVAATGLVAWTAIRSLTAVSLARAEADARVLAQTMARGVVVDMVADHGGDPALLRRRMAEALEPFDGRAGLRSSFLAAHGGKVLISSDPDRPAGSTLPRRDAACAVCHAENARGPESAGDAVHVATDRAAGVVRAVAPITNAPGCGTAPCHAHDASRKVLGVIAVEATLEPVYATLGTQRARLIGIALVTAIVGPLLSLLFLRRWLDRPVHDLIEGIRRVSEGRLDAVVPPADGELGRVAVAFNRMQARVAASQKQVVQSEKMASLGKLAAGVAHEINNPLTGVLAYTEDLIDDTPEGDPRREEYRVIQRETLRCREIVRHLLDFARHGETRRMPTSINDVLRRTVELVAHLPSFRDVRIVEDLQEGLPRIEGDPGQLQQVFLNFLVNAAEAMPHGGEAKIVTRLRRDAPGIVASVTDSGAGIPEEMLDRIFEPFFSTKGGKSNGLGLSVSWGIIEQHGGQIEVQSQRDKGTTFKVYLPA